MSKEKPPIYDEAGRVKDPDVAHKMAEVEDKYHKKTLGIPATKWDIRRGEQKAEEVVEKGEEIDEEQLPTEVKDLLRHTEYNTIEKKGPATSWYNDKIIKINYGNGRYKYVVFAIQYTGISNEPGIEIPYKFTINVEPGRESSLYRVPQREPIITIDYEWDADVKEAKRGEYSRHITWEFERFKEIKDGIKKVKKYLKGKK